MPARINVHGNLHIDPPKECAKCKSLKSQLTEAKKERVCRWHYDYIDAVPSAKKHWQSECGISYNTGPDEYCQHCGGKVEVV